MTGSLVCSVAVVVVAVCGTAGGASVLAMMKQLHQQNSCCSNVCSVDHGGSNIYHWCTKEP